MANPPTTDPAAKIAADSSTGTATEQSVSKNTEAQKAAEETKQSAEETQREPGSLWTAPPTIPEGEQENEDAKKRAAEEEKARLENPDEVVYRAADTEL